MVLQWGPVAGAKSYQVQWSTNSSFQSGANQTVASDTTSTASYSLESLLTPGRDYYWRIRASYPTARTTGSTTDTYTEYSEARRFSLVWSDSSAPQLTSPADSSLPANAVMAPTFRWASVPGASRYKIQVSASPTLTPTTIDQTVLRNWYTPKASLNPGAYYWRVASLDADGNTGPWSEVREFYRDWLGTDGLSARPIISLADDDPNTDGVQTQMYRDEVLIQWDPIPGASHYEVQFASSGNGSFQNAAASARLTCKTPNTAVTPVQTGSYSRTGALSACALQKKASGLDLWDEPYAWVRVRAIDKPTSGTEVPSLWSDQARAGESAPGPVRLDLVDPPTTGSSISAPAAPEAPTSGSLSRLNPVLTWERTADTDSASKYLVALSKSATFNPSELDQLGSSALYYVVTANRHLVLQEELLDSLSGESYYWYVLPCRTWETTTNNSGCVSDNQAISTAAVRSFRKVTSAVRDLNATLPTGDTGIGLSWADQVDTERLLAAQDTNVPTVGVQHYRIQISTDPGFQTQLKLDTTVDAVEHVPEIDLKATETYYWRVAAVDGAGQRLTWSDVAQFVPVLMPAPSSLSVAGQGSMASLIWSPTRGAAKYEVELFTGTSPDFPIGNRVATYPQFTEYASFTPPTQLPMGTYSWRVRTVDHSGTPGQWAAGPEPYLVGLPTPSLSLPANGAAVTDATHGFTWSPVAGATEYTVQVSTQPDFTSTIDTITTNDTEAISTKDGGYPAGDYYWRVQARTSLGVASDVATRTFTHRTAPGVPRNVSATASSSAGGALDLTWEPPALLGGTPVTAYRMWLRSGGGAWSELTPVSGDTAARTVTGLGAATTVDVRIAAVNAVGTGPQSAIETATTGDVPGAPSAPRITASTSGFKATWGSVSARPAVTGYEYQYRPAAGGWLSGTTTTRELTVGGLPSSTSYEFQVRAVNAAGPGPWALASPFSTATPKPTTTPEPAPKLLPPGAPGTPTGKAKGKGKKRTMTVKWTAPRSGGAVVSYSVERSANKSTWKPVSATSTTAKWKSKKGKRVYVRVRAKNAAGWGAYSTIATLKG